MTMEKIYVRNRHGIRVRKWCKSCRHMVYDDNGKRYCSKMPIKVVGDFCCPLWAMNETLLSL